MQDTILFLAKIVKFVPKDTIVSINDDIFTVGPSGISMLRPDASETPAYVVRYEAPMEKNWQSIISHMKSGKMIVRDSEAGKNIGERVIKLVSVFM